MDLKRISSALIGFPLVAIILIFGNKYLVDIAVSIIAILSLHEYFHSFKEQTQNKNLRMDCLYCGTTNCHHSYHSTRVHIKSNCSNYSYFHLSTICSNYCNKYEIQYQRYCNYFIWNLLYCHLSNVHSYHKRDS